MTWLRTALAELWALFVDDGLLAVLAILWLTIIGFAARSGAISRSILALILFAGLAAILVASITRAARGAASRRAK